MPRSRAGLGNRGEDLARRFLANKGFSILETNYRCRWGEVDIVARSGDELVFVEVRTRSGDAFGSPEESVTEGKARRLAETAQTFLQDGRWRMLRGGSTCWRYGWIHGETRGSITWRTRWRGRGQALPPPGRRGFLNPSPVIRQTTMESRSRVANNMPTIRQVLAAQELFLKPDLDCGNGGWAGTILYHPAITVLQPNLASLRR